MIVLNCAYMETIQVSRRRLYLVLPLFQCSKLIYSREDISDESRNGNNCSRLNIRHERLNIQAYQWTQKVMKPGVWLRPIFFIKCFTGNFEKNSSRGGRNKNKNKTRNSLNIFFYFRLQVTFCVRINEVKYMSLVSIIVVYRHIQWYFRKIPMQ